jgi:hypothetical protein
MSFDINRLRRADRIVGIGGIAFFIFLYLFKWYGFSSNVPSIAGLNVNTNISANGWHTFTNSRWIWLLTIIVALASVVLVATQRRLELPIQAGVIVAALGALSAVLIFYRIVHHPSASASFGSFHASVGIKIGIWLGLIAALVITYGGYVQMHEEGTSLARVREQAEGAIGGLADSVRGGADAPAASDVSAPAPAAPPAHAAGEGADEPSPG